MSTYDIELTYNAYSSTRITLPEGKSWDDMEDWYVKWNTLNFRLKGEDGYREIDLTIDIHTDTMRPSYTCIVPVDDDGVADYDNPVCED